ncbi:MAG TPA: family 31 glucosidase, partial [Verrucomicrobiae bacterium]|nr:family 31 glucosidase [Verrucomicrobiae bacterium]
MNPNNSIFAREQNRLTWHFKDQILWLEPWGKDSIRVRATTLAAMPLHDWSLLPPKKSAVKITIGKDSARLTNGRLTATIDSKSGRVRFFKSGKSEPLCEEIFVRTNYPASRTFKSAGGDLFQCEASFTAFDDERIYGLGQRRHGLLDQKGC